MSPAPTERRTMARPPAEVWEQLTSPHGFERWMGPGSTIEPEPGGVLIAADPESGVPKVGRVLDVDHQRRLRWVWRPLGDDPDGGGATEVEIELEPVGTPGDLLDDDPDRSGPSSGGTVVTVVERPSNVGIDSIGTPTAIAMAGCGR